MTVTNTQDSQLSPRIGQRLPAEGGSKIEIIETTISLPESAWPGRMVFNVEEAALQVFIGGAGEGSWLTVGTTTKTYVQADEPVSASVGDFWVDTDVDPNALYIYDGADWVAYVDPLAEQIRTLQVAVHTGVSPNQRVELDQDGLRGYASGDALKTEIDAATGLLTATGGVFRSDVSGERVEVNDEGISTYTDNSVPNSRMEFQGYKLSLQKASDRDYLYYLDASFGHVYRLDVTADQYDLETWGNFEAMPGESVYAAECFGLACASEEQSGGTYIWVINNTDDIVKRAVAPMAPATVYTKTGTYYDVAVDPSETYFYAVDDSWDIHKFDCATGTEVVGGGWPLATSFFTASVIATNTHVFVVADAGTEMHKYAASNAVEDTSFNWPLTTTGSFWDEATDGVNVFYTEDGVLHCVDVAQGSEVYLKGFPKEDLYYDGVTASERFTIGSTFSTDDNPGWMYSFNNLAEFESVKIDPSKGSVRANDIHTAKIKATFGVDTPALTILDRPHDAKFHTRGSRTAAHTIADNDEINISFDTWQGSSQNGPYWSWSTTNRRWTILQSGLYLVSGGIQYAGNSTGIRRTRLVAGSFVAGQTGLDATTAAIYHSVSLGAIFLQAGNVVYIAGFQNTGAALSIVGTGTWISIARLGIVAV